MENVAEILGSLISKESVKEIEYCPKCNTPMHCKVNFMGYEQIVPCLCKCRSQEREEQEEQERLRQVKYRVERLRQQGISDPQHEQYCFKNDDEVDSELSTKCKKYANGFDQMLEQNIGLLFYGDVGTGKSFYACCIANALIDNGIAALVTSMPRIINRFKSMTFQDDKNIFVNSFAKYPLVVIDDIGVENGTEFAHEIMFQIIDTRYKSKKPLIVTTNLSPSDMKQPSNVGYKRLFDRIIECCVPLKVTGESRRYGLMKNKQDVFNDFLKG